MFIEEKDEKTAVYGVVVGIVTNNQDPEQMGRAKVNFPWLDSNDESYWARIATFMGGKERGAYFLPEIGDEVLVSFEHGDVHQPYILGSLWNGQDKPPETNSDGKNNKRIIKSRSGHKIILDDTQGNEKVEILTNAGHAIVLDDSSGNEKIEIKDKTGNNSISIDSAQNSLSIKSQMKISIEAQMIEIKGQMKIGIEAQMIEIKAGATLNLQGGLVKIN
jgi:uncharacterized protein involved in type VI secretion and phage assembly